MFVLGATFGALGVLACFGITVAVMYRSWFNQQRAIQKAVADSIAQDAAPPFTRTGYNGSN